MKKWILCIAALSMIVTVFGAEMTPAERRMRAINGAKLIAERNIVETVLGAQIEYAASISDLDASTFKSTMQSSTKGKIRGIRMATEYDTEKDYAIATAELDVSKVADLAPAWKGAQSQIIRRVGFSSVNPKAITLIKTIRAAELDAYRALYQQISSFQLESNTTVKDLMLKDDRIASRCVGALFCAKMIVDPMDKDTIEWTDKTPQAGCTVTLELVVKDFEAVLGQKLVGCKADVIRVKGVGLPYKKEEPKKQQPAPIVKTVVKIVEKPVTVVKEKKIIVESESKTQKVGSSLLP